MVKVLFEVDTRHRVAMFDKLVEQAPRRAVHGELSFSMHIDDNARHIAYILLDWHSLESAHKFLDSKASHDLVAEWPIEKVLGAMPLRDLGAELSQSASGAT